MSNTVIPHGYVVPDTDPHELDGNVYYLPVLEFEDANDYPGPFSDQAGLVLKRIDSGTLYRVGSYEIWLIEGIEMFRASIRDHECSEDCRVGEPAGVDENGHQLVTITIV